MICTFRAVFADAGLASVQLREFVFLVFEGNALQVWCLLMLCSYFGEECVCRCFWCCDCLCWCYCSGVLAGLILLRGVDGTVVDKCCRLVL